MTAETDRRVECFWSSNTECMSPNTATLHGSAYRHVQVHLTGRVHESEITKLMYVSAMQRDIQHECAIQTYMICESMIETDTQYRET